MILRLLPALLLIAPAAARPTTLAAQAAAQQTKVTVKADKPSYLREATVSADSAIRVALARIPSGQVRQAALEREDDRLVYSFDIAVAGKAGIDEVLVDAKTGEVVEVAHESPEDEAREEKKEKQAENPYR